MIRGFVSPRISLAVVLIVLIGHVEPSIAQSGSIESLRQARSFFALPMELDIDRGAENGNAAILRIMPLYSFTISGNMKLVNLTIVTLADAPGTPAYPGEPGAEKTAGVADLLHASFFTPERKGIPRPHHESAFH